MFPATALDGDAQQWTVSGRLRERQEERRLRVGERAMRPGLWQAPAGGDGGPAGGPFIVALLFAQPDAAAMEVLDSRGDYFDIRTGDAWDLFFPGYSRVPRGIRTREQVNPALRYYQEAKRGRVLLGTGYTDEWRFSPRDFNAMRAAVERRCERRWEYSGGTDLVVTGGWMPLVGEPVIDWALTVSSHLDTTVGTGPHHTLGGAIELISRDLEQQLEDPAFNLGGPIQADPASETFMKKVMVSAVGGILAGVAKWGLGI